jgi:hypothetical protein
MHFPAGPFVPASVVLMVVSLCMWLCMRAMPCSLAHTQQLQASKSTPQGVLPLLRVRAL